MGMMRIEGSSFLRSCPLDPSFKCVLEVLSHESVLQVWPWDLVQRIRPLSVTLMSCAMDPSFKCDLKVLSHGSALQVWPWVISSWPLSFSFYPRWCHQVFRDDCSSKGHKFGFVLSLLQMSHMNMVINAKQSEYNTFLGLQRGYKIVFLNHEMESKQIIVDTKPTNCIYRCALCL